jgi:hypothetical protein
MVTEAFVATSPPQIGGDPVFQLFLDSEAPVNTSRVGGCRASGL